MDQKSATVLITKLGAAERQLNAAIRMALADEDELAIHTVAAAAYRVLRDIKQKRGRSDAHDLFMRGLFSVALDIATGKKESIPEAFAYPGSPLIGVIQTIRDQILAGTIKTWEDVPPVKISNEGKFWYEFNQPVNFLKHAISDPDGVFDLSKIKNEELLMRAMAAFFEIVNRTTPEIEAYYIFISGHLDDSGLPEEVRLAFGKLTPARKRKKCLAWLRKRRTLNSSVALM